MGYDRKGEREREREREKGRVREIYIERDCDI